ncbi:MAG TPA: DUF4340 domain-containing protein [Polyangia bacterium]|nr:DUF4340 domain-containing protein [Polyangia bacterium]
MTGRAAATQGGLAAVGLLAALLTSQRQPEHAPGSVTVIDATKMDVTHVHYTDDHNAVDFERGHGDKDAPVWIHLVPTAEVSTPDKKNDKGKPEAANPKEPAPPSPPRDLVGSEQATKVLDQFAPLVSPRAFGQLDATKLKELGLDAPTRKLDVTVKGEVHHYVIGQPDKATGGESFLRDTGDGHVYLMPRGMLADLQNPNHLVDRRLHGFEPGDFDRMVLAAGGKTKEYVQLDREARAKAAFAPAKTPDKRDQMAKNWHDAVWRAFPSDILGRGEEPAGGKPSVVLRVDYFDGKSSVGYMELGREESSSGVSEEAASEAPSGDIYARTEHSAGWLKLHNGGQLLADAQKLLAAP